jgi:hypothetical protein
LLGGRFERGRTVADDLYFVALPLQRTGQRISDGRIVLGK